MKKQRDLTGASESRILVRPLLYWVTRSSKVREESKDKVVMQEERESMLMSLKLRSEMTQGGLEMERRRVTLNDRRRWSIIWSWSAVQLEGETRAAD